MQLLTQLWNVISFRYFLNVFPEIVTVQQSDGCSSDVEGYFRETDINAKIHSQNGSIILSGSLH